MTRGGSTVKCARTSDLTGRVPAPLTFLKPIPEGARSTHCSALLIQRHGAVPEAAVSVGVILAICIGQAVGPQHRWVGQAHLGDGGGTRWNQRSRMRCWVSIPLSESQPGYQAAAAYRQQRVCLPTSLPCLFLKGSRISI